MSKFRSLCLLFLIRCASFLVILFTLDGCSPPHSSDSNGTALGTAASAAALMARTTIKTTTTKTTTKTTTTRTTGGGGGTPLAAPCSGRGQCETTANGLHCACYSGYTGRFCELSKFFRPCVFRNLCVIMLSYRNYRCVYCADLNECTPNPCKNGGICSDGVGEFECECLPGWSGRCFCCCVGW